MPERDFDGEFGDIMARHFAPEDPELVELYRGKMYRSGDLEDPSYSQFVDGLVRWQYPMSRDQFRVAKIKVLAGLIDGVERGEDLFRAEK